MVDYRTSNYPKIVKHVEIDFDEVEVGVTKIKSIKILNQCNVRQKYSVRRDPTSNPLDCVFHIVDYNWSLEPCNSYICDISYRPILPNRKYVDYFFITDSYKCCYEILVRGKSVGPNVIASSKRLILVCENENCTAEKSFKLTNHSRFSAKFMFDIDAIQCPFKIVETSGVIKAASSKQFNVSFESNNVGIYKYNLICLILNQDPIIIELYGLCGHTLDAKHIQLITSKIEDDDKSDITNNFTSYMSDVITAVKRNPPLISLSNSFLDFGYVEIGLENYAKRPPLTTSLTNHTNDDLLVVWDKDVAEVFGIHPCQAKILGHQSVIFEIRFDPTEKRTLHSRELLARIFRLPCCSSLIESYNELFVNVIPEFVSIRLIGHTYGKNSNNGIPQYEIPETVIMPACAPASPAYATFAIKNFGKQPLLFCFIPPAICHYSVKPTVGLVMPEQEYQMIAVRLFAESDGNHAYVERWACRLNGYPDNEIYIDFHGFAEQPNLIFGDENHVIFDPVHVYCHESRTVSVRNSTRHSIRFELSSYNFPKELSIQEMSGTVDPNETVFYDWIFAPDQLKAYDFIITCHLTMEDDGKSFDFEIEVSGSGMEGFLIAIPEDLDFGVHEYEESKEMLIKVFNFSPVTINFLLVHHLIKSIDNLNSNDDATEISPISKSIRPGKSEKIQIVVTPSHPGRHEVIVEYLTRSCVSDDNPVSQLQPKHLCKIFYTCYLSTLQIKDILYQAETNKNLSKISLWKSLNIDDLNCIFKDLLPCKDASIEMTLPFDSLNENEKFIIKLLVVNVNPVKATCSFKKKRTCFCSDEVTAKKSLTKRNFKNECTNCVLDRSCAIFPENIMLMPNEKCILSIEIISNPLISSGLFWNLNIEHKRCISFNINLENPVISSGCYLKFKNVFIGQCMTVHYQAIWLYNNTEDESSYVINTKNLVSCNKKNHGIIFTCLNPVGKISPNDRKAVLFGFSPTKIGRFQVNVLVRIDERESLLKMDAESTATNVPIATYCEACPCSYTFLSKDIIVYFNMDCIIMLPLPTYGKETKVIMIHNHHPHDVLHYQWENYEIPGIIKVKVEPANGLIQPQTLLTFIVEVTAGKYACSLSIDVFCNFTDVSERRLAEKKMAQQNDILRELENEFTITENGISYPEKPCFEERKRPSTYCKTLTLKIDVYNPRDANEKVKLEQQLKSMPVMEMMQEMIPCEDTFPANNITVFSQIIECITWDIVNSKFFAEMFKNNLTQVHHLKYSQLSTNIFERKKQKERSNCVPPKLYIENILHTMIKMIIHEEFNLNINHFSHPADARQISYQKVYLKAHNTETGFEAMADMT